MGAVAYDPKVVTIWEGFREWFRAAGFDFDFVLYSNYERQVEELVAGRIDAAWNSPLAWVRTVRLARTQGADARALVMRDTDRDLTSVVVASSGSGITSIEQLRGRRVATGAVDSPQATLLPLLHLRDAGLEPGVDFDVQRFDVGVGLHGDHIGGERDAARALMRGEVDAACMTDANHLEFSREGTLPRGSSAIVTQTEAYDHCNMSVVGDSSEALARFAALLESMDYGSADVRGLMDLEGLKRWLPGRTPGYVALERAASELEFYDDDGDVTARDYRP